MTSILKSDNGELFIFRNEKEFPKAEAYKGYGSTIQWKRDHANWFATSERIKVAEDKDTFLFQLRSRGHLLCLNDHLDGFLGAGIEIPESCYEVRPHDKADTLEMERMGLFAYFKDDRASEKETGKKGIRFVDPDIQKRFEQIDPEFKRQLREKWESDRPHDNTSLDPKEHAIDGTICPDCGNALAIHGTCPTINCDNHTVYQIHNSPYAAFEKKIYSMASSLFREYYSDEKTGREFKRLMKEILNSKIV